MNPAEFANIARLEDSFWWFRGMRRILWALLDPYSSELHNRPWLEAGCGTGYMSGKLEERYGCRVVGCDLGDEGLAYARSAGRRTLAKADIRALPFETETFSGLISLDVLVHLPRGQESVALREFARVLRWGGLLCLRVSALDILRSRHSEFAHERQRFTRSRLLPALEDAGFSILRSTYANSLLTPVALAKFRLWEPLTKQRPSSGVTPVAPVLNRALQWPLGVEARWLGMGGNLPIGQSIVVLARKKQT